MEVANRLLEGHALAALHDARRLEPLLCACLSQNPPNELTIVSLQHLELKLRFSYLTLAIVLHLGQQSLRPQLFTLSGIFLGHDLLLDHAEGP